MFRSRIDCIQKLNKNKNIINKALEQLITLRKALLALLIAEASNLVSKDLNSEKSLDDDFIEVLTFNEYMVNLSQMLKVNIGVDVPQQVSFSMIELPGYFQNIIAKLGSNGLIFKSLFSLLLEANKLAKISEKINSIIVATGWFPFMSGIINTSNFNARYSEHIKVCVEVIDKYLGDKGKFKYKNLNIAIIRADSLDTFTILIEQFEIVSGLSELNNPQLLKELSSHFKSEINDLLRLQRITECTVIDTDRLQELIACVSVVDSDFSADFTIVENIKSVFTNAMMSFNKDSQGGLQEFTQVVKYTEPLIKYFELSQFHQGLIFLQNKQYQSALDCFNSIKWLNDDKLFYNRGVCYLSLEQRSAAITEFKQIDNDTFLARNAMRILRMTAFSTKNSSSQSEVSEATSYSSPKDGLFERQDESVLSSNAVNSIYNQFHNFRYLQPLESRIRERELQLVPPPRDISEIEVRLKADKKTHLKNVYIYFNSHQQLWNYFYSKNAGKKYVMGELLANLMPLTYPELQSQFDKAKEYLLTVILDEKFRKAFQKQLNYFSQATSDEISLEQSETSDLMLSQSLL